jgi:hypothetical protein
MYIIDMYLNLYQMHVQCTLDEKSKKILKNKIGCGWVTKFIFKNRYLKNIENFRWLLHYAQMYWHDFVWHHCTGMLLVNRSDRMVHIQSPSSITHWRILHVDLVMK